MWNMALSKKTLFCTLFVLFTIFIFASPLAANSSSYTFSIYTAANNQLQNPPTVTNFTPNSTVVIEGSVCPNPIIGVGSSIYSNATYVRPDGSTFSHQTTISEFNYCSQGDLVDSFNPTMQGTWTVSAVATIDWGNGTLTNIQSNQVSFTVGASSSAGSLGVMSLPIVGFLLVIAVVVIVFLLRKRIF
ncbi:MAG: hypothetical protein ACYCQJ_02540 [Nitrososphaerales archaeon]